MHRNSLRGASRLARTLVCATAALPVLFVAGCGSGSGDAGGDSGTGTPSASESSAQSPAAVKYTELPDACKSLSAKTVKDLVKGTDNAAGKRIGTGDTNDSGSCLWSGLDKYDYRQLTVSLKRFDSDAGRDSGDKLAKVYAEQQIDDARDNKDNKGVKTAEVEGVGQQATAARFEQSKKDNKGDAEAFRAERLVTRDANVVVVVDYEGAGFEDGKTPSADSLTKDAQKAAKETLSGLK